MAGLEQVGIPGPDHLREALTNCTDPLAAIEEFQIQNGILLPSLRPALPFLDLHDVKRLDFHQSVMEELREKLLQKISEVAERNDKNRNKILNDLLNKCFPGIKVKSLRPVVMGIMQHLPKIKLEYLKVVMGDPDLYKEASIQVRQQIWQDNQALFGDEVSPLLSKYIDDRESILYGCATLSQTFFSPSPKMRRQDEVVQQLAKMIGKNIKLYDMVLQFLRTLFLRTRNIHYCTLRAELLMALHDNEVHEIVSVDPCHKFTWCLDACIREKFVDSKRSRELQGFLDSMRRGQEQVLGDLSMILCDPHAINTIAVSTMQALLSLISAEGLPRHNDEMVLLFRMLTLGLGSWNMIDSQIFKEPRPDSQLVTRFLPCVMAMMVDDQLALQTSASKPTEANTQQLEPVCEYVIAACRKNTIATSLLLYYAVQAAKQKETAPLMRVLPRLTSFDPDTVYSDPNLHTMVSHLALMPEAFSKPDFCDAVFEHFFLPYISRENVVHHLFRLLWWVHIKVVPAVLDKLMKTLAPSNQHSEALDATYKALSNKISSYQPSPVAEPKKLDSPLMAVPAPTPAHV